jgi:hypothetical protein
MWLSAKVVFAQQRSRKDTTMAKASPRRALKTAHLRALQNRTPVGGHFQNRTLDLLRWRDADLI